MLARRPAGCASPSQGCFPVAAQCRCIAPTRAKPRTCHGRCLLRALRRHPRCPRCCSCRRSAQAQMWRVLLTHPLQRCACSAPPTALCWSCAWSATPPAAAVAQAARRCAQRVSLLPSCSSTACACPLVTGLFPYRRSRRMRRSRPQTMTKSGALQRRCWRLPQSCLLPPKAQPHASKTKFAFRPAPRGCWHRRAWAPTMRACGCALAVRARRRPST